MAYKYLFGSEVLPFVQQDRSPNKIFVLVVHVSAVHARWKKGGRVVCQALIVDSTIKVLPLAHPRQVGALGVHCEK